MLNKIKFTSQFRIYCVMRSCYVVWIETALISKALFMGSKTSCWSGITSRGDGLRISSVTFSRVIQKEVSDLPWMVNCSEVVVACWVAPKSTSFWGWESILASSRMVTISICVYAASDTGTLDCGVVFCFTLKFHLLSPTNNHECSINLYKRLKVNQNISHPYSIACK